MVLRVSAFCIAACFSINVAYSEEAPARDVVLNGRGLNLQELQAYDKLFCGTIPDGHYWLNENTLEWGGEGLPSRGYFDAKCFAKGEPQHALKRVEVNGQVLSRVQIYFLETIACGPIPPGQYWLDLKTGLWGHQGGKGPLGHIKDNCQEGNRGTSLSERGQIFGSGDFYYGGCPSPPCHD